MFLAYSGFSQGESLTCRGNPGPQAISKSSKSWTSSLNQSQPLAGKPVEHNAGPHHIKQQCKCRVNSQMYSGISFHSESLQPTESLSHLSFPLSILPFPCLPPSSSFLGVSDPRVHPVIFGFLWCRVDLSSPTLDTQVVLRETRKNGQDMDDKYKQWKKELKRKGKTTSFLVLRLPRIQDHQLSVKHSK